MGRYGVPSIILVCVILLGVIVRLIFIFFEERNKVVRLPREPMFLCDTHGAIPERLVFRTSAPQEGKPDLINLYCPVCYKDRIDATKEMIHKLDTDPYKGLKIQ